LRRKIREGKRRSEETTRREVVNRENDDRGDSEVPMSLRK
jgi:hypothetical protein